VRYLGNRRKLRNSLFFSLLAGNLGVGDRFHGTAFPTRLSARTDVISLGRK
jgi:hypothetical protein